MAAAISGRLKPRLWAAKVAGDAVVPWRGKDGAINLFPVCNVGFVHPTDSAMGFLLSFGECIRF